MVLQVDDLVSTGRTTAEEIHQAVSLQAFITSKQRSTLGLLTEAVTHPVSTLLQSYAEEGTPATTGPLWSRTALDEATRNGLNESS